VPSISDEQGILLQQDYLLQTSMDLLDQLDAANNNLERLHRQVALLSGACAPDGSPPGAKLANASLAAAVWANISRTFGPEVSNGRTVVSAGLAAQVAALTDQTLALQMSQAWLAPQSVVDNSAAVQELYGNYTVVVPLLGRWKGQLGP
jgi:hypothetical protein